MTATAFGMPLTILRDGVVATSEGVSRPLPLVGTEIDVEVRSGLAITKLARRFRNAEADPIEVLMTFPVGFHSAVTGLSAAINGRTLVGRAQPKDQARAVYEEALDRGELAVLHEEPLRGLNVVSIAPLPPGAEVEVCAEIVTPLSAAPNGLFLRLPMTIGDVYGDSPLMPADDVLTARGLAGAADLFLRCDNGTARLADGRIINAEGLKIELTAAIEITIEGGRFRAVNGRAADGRRVDLRLAPLPAVDAPLSCAILFDRSGSTNGGFPGTSGNVWQAMRNGLAAAFSGLSDAEEIALWHFDDEANLLGKSRGCTAARELIGHVGVPHGGTELIQAVMAAAAAGAKQILVLTDGQTWATQAPAELDACVSAVLVGSASLDAGIGQFATQTGGEVFYAAGRETEPAISAALASLRAGSSRAMGEIVDGAPKELACARSGVSITAKWSAAVDAGEPTSDPVGRFAASLALPLFAHAQEASAFAAAHDLACHLTSLVLVDPLTTSEAGLPRTVRQPLALAEVVHSNMSYSMSSFAGSASLRMPSFDDLPRPGDLSRRKPESRSLFDRLLRRHSNSSAEVIKWDSDANKFLKNDLSSLPASVLKILQDWAEEEPVKRLAEQTKQPVLLVALALYAERDMSSDRNARRFAKKVLAGVTPQEIGEAGAHFFIS